MHLPGTGQLNEWTLKGKLDTRIPPASSTIRKNCKYRNLDVDIQVVPGFRRLSPGISQLN